MSSSLDQLKPTAQDEPSARCWLKSNLKRTFFALLCTALSALFMTAMQGVSDNRAIASGLDKGQNQHGSDPNSHPALPDILMDSAPHWFPVETADILLNSFIAFSAVSFLLTWRWRVKHYGPTEGHFRSLRMARRFFWMLTTAYALRSISIISTTMPPSDPRCVYRQRNWLQLALTGLEIMSKTGNTCSDKIFSGHSSIATLLGFFWSSALLRRERRGEVAPALWKKFAAFAVISWISAIYVACVLCRNHYSIDIVVACLVCTAIFSIYNLSVRIVELFRSSGDYDRLVRRLKRDSVSLLAAPLDEIVMQEIVRPNQQETIASDQPSTPVKQKQETLPLPLEAGTARRLPTPFKLYLRAMHWMDGFDLQERRGLFCSN